MSKSIALCLCVMTTTGCIATHRSNTDWYEETMHVGIINKPPPGPKAEGVVPAPLVFAGELALKAAADLVARQFLALENHGFQPRVDGSLGRGGRGQAGADDHHIN